MNNEIVRTLLDGHRIMERVLTLIRLQVDMLRTTTDAAGFALLTSAVGYMHTSPRLLHHPAEENIFDRLIRHAPHTLALCRRLSEQHKGFGRQETVLLRRLRGAQCGDAAACRDVQQMGTLYCLEHANHIRNEETEALPQAIKWLPETDWRKIGEDSELLADPYSEANALKRYGSLYDYLMASDVNFNRH